MKKNCSLPDSKPGASAKAGMETFRLLKSDEFVTRGDFVVGECRGYEPWDGPIGFRADAYVKSIYRLNVKRVTRTTK